MRWRSRVCVALLLSLVRLVGRLGPGPPVPAQVGLPPLRGHLLDQDQRQEPRAPQEPRAARRVPAHQGALPDGHQGHRAPQHRRGLYPRQRGHRPHHLRGAAVWWHREARGDHAHR
uniref:Putative secreted protein n=1 Tax=Ixodes scapularis TaxID=6945 RepID=A0A4D5RCC7_IXOSC